MKLSLNKFLKKVNIFNRKKLEKDDKQRLIMCLPVIIYLFIFNYLPMGGIILAFKDFQFHKGIFGSDWVGFDNFEFFFNSQHAWRVTRNTVGYNIAGIILMLIVSVGLALLLYEFKKAIYIKIYQTAIILPHFLSWVIVGFITFALLHHQKGTFNQILNAVGLDSIEWYYQKVFWPFFLTILRLWKGFGMSCVLYYAALMGIDKNLFEAAEIDGASKWQITWRIKIPMLVPLMTILTILAVGRIFRADFGLFWQIPRQIGTLWPVVDVIDTYVFKALRQVGDIGMGAAVGLYQSIVGFILILTTNAIVRKIESDNALF